MIFDIQSIIYNYLKIDDKMKYSILTIEYIPLIVSDIYDKQQLITYAVKYNHYDLLNYCMKYNIGVWTISSTIMVAIKNNNVKMLQFLYKNVRFLFDIHYEIILLDSILYITLECLEQLLKFYNIPQNDTYFLNDHICILFKSYIRIYIKELIIYKIKHHEKLNNEINTFKELGYYNTINMNSSIKDDKKIFKILYRYLLNNEKIICNINGKDEGYPIICCQFNKYINNYIK